MEGITPMEEDFSVAADENSTLTGTLLPHRHHGKKLDTSSPVMT